MFLSGIKLKLQITINRTAATIKGLLFLFDAEASAFVIWFLRFVISSLAKELVLECFYRVWQNLTSQVLIVKT